MQLIISTCCVEIMPGFPVSSALTFSQQTTRASDSDSDSKKATFFLSRAHHAAVQVARTQRYYC